MAATGVYATSFLYRQLAYARLDASLALLDAAPRTLGATPRERGLEVLPGPAELLTSGHREGHRRVVTGDPVHVRELERATDHDGRGGLHRRRRVAPLPTGLCKR